MYPYDYFQSHPWVFPYRTTLHPYGLLHPSSSFRQYPAVDPAIFMSSAQHMRPLLRDAGTLLNKMGESWQFSFDLMSAAQESNQAKVEQLIKGAGITIVPRITYNPDGLNLYFTTTDNQVDCCHLTLKLRWR